jgi:tetratricopeptide (TPR) repeat protein
LDDTYIDPLIGETVSQYEVVAKLGGGGMGVVYKATDTKLGRPVALKFLPPQWSHDEGAKQRFVREAQAASATNHPNICVIHNIEQTADGRLFIVMAYYEGQTLKQKLEAGPLTLGDALEIAAEVAEGLAKAHAQGIVHRDVKPGNLIVTDDGVKILDFGLAKFADSLQLTMPGSTVGTVAYMSPEQARGEEADARSDVWALGVVLYEMLTGEVPFKGAYAEATFHAIKNEPVPAPSAPGRDIPPAVDALVLRALEKDPDRRYQNARELARDLRLLQGRTIPLDLRTEPLPVLAPLQPARPVSWWRRVRNGLTVGRAVAAGAVVVTAVVGTTYWLSRPVVRIPVAVAPVANHTGEPALDEYRLALTEALVAELSDAPNIRVVPYLRLAEIVRPFRAGADMSGREAIDALTAQSGARVVIIPTIEYRNGAWLARAEFRSAETGTNVMTFETAAQTSSLPKETAYRLMPALADGIYAHFKTKAHPPSVPFRTIEAAKAFEEGLNQYEQLEYSAALDALRRAAAQDDQPAATHAWLSRVLLILNRGNEAVASSRRAKQLVTADTPKSESAFVEAVLAESQADITAADQRYRQLVTVSPDESWPHAELADFLKRQNRNQEAVDRYHESLRMDVSYVRPHVELCQLYTRLDDQPLAEQHARTALDKYHGAGNRGGEAQALLCLGELQRVQAGSRLVDARKNVEAARAIFEALRQPYNLSRAYQYLGAVAMSERNYKQAADSFGEALVRSRQVGNRQLEAVELQNLGAAYQEMGQRAEALDYYQQGRDVYQQIGDERRAAEQEVNVANLLIHFGRDHADTLRRLTNARATLKKLGFVAFDVYAMQLQAASQIYSGRHVDGRRVLREALTLAKERKLTNRSVSLTIDLAQSYFLTNEYETARTLLEELRNTESGRGNLEARITLGRVYVRLGDFDAARSHLEPALASIAERGQSGLTPLAYLALGELAYESGRLDEASGHFSKAAALTKDLPDAASIEARCYQGLLDARAGKVGATMKVAASAEHGKAIARVDLEARCRLHLARIDFGQRRVTQAVHALDALSADSETTLGPELRAQLHDWRARALTADHDTARAQAERASAQTLIQALQASLPAQYRDRFAARPDIHSILEPSPNNPR